MHNATVEDGPMSMELGERSEIKCTTEVGKQVITKVWPCGKGENE